jgi:aminopeptidase N
MVDLNAVYLNFDGITYAKGAAVLRQLVAWVGLEAFLRGVSHYFKAHAWGNTTFADLMSALGAASGRDLGDWAAKWLQSVGVNTIRLQVTTEGGHYGQVELLQQPAVAPPGVQPVLRPHRVAVGAYRWQGPPGARRLVRAERHELDLVGQSAQVAGLAGVAVAPLLLPNDDDLTFAKIRLDPDSRAIAFEHVSQLADPLARALVWGCAWDMVRDAELPAQQYLKMVARSLGQEPNSSVLSAVHATLVETIGRFLPADRIGPAQVELAEATLAHARGSQPGGDAQLLHLRAFVRHARSSSQLEVLSAILAPGSGEVVAGLPVDQELRWDAVTRLVALGAQPASIIADELERDPTMPGQRAAALATAAQPVPAAKEAAWRAALSAVGVGWRTGATTGEPDGEPLSNAALRATVGGFGYPEQAELVAGYAASYFQVVRAIWGSGSPNNAAEVARGLFPAGQVSQDNLAAARAFLDQPGLDPGLARVVAEGADGLARALRARACSDHHWR